jgi:electron transfer flavoprotein beta subunit
VLDEINERAVEDALLLTEAHGGAVTVVCLGPDRANEAIRKALAAKIDFAAVPRTPSRRGPRSAPDDRGCGAGTARRLRRRYG